jgi:cytochrome c oxidase subunit III
MATYPIAHPPAFSRTDAGSGIGGHGDGSFGGNNSYDSRHGGGGRIPQRAYVTGMMIALAAILMFFVALVSAFVVRKGFPNSDWLALSVPRILWLNTLFLAASSFTMARSCKYFHADRAPEFRRWWTATIFLGIAFLAGQVIAWRQLVSAGVYLASNPSSSFFYVFTAVHGIHFLGGIAALLGVRFARPSRLTMETAIRIVSMYWHFMDGLWLCLFFLLILGQ